MAQQTGKVRKRGQQQTRPVAWERVESTLVREGFQPLTKKNMLEGQAVAFQIRGLEQGMGLGGSRTQPGAVLCRGCKS